MGCETFRPGSSGRTVTGRNVKAAPTTLGSGRGTWPAPLAFDRTEAVRRGLARPPIRAEPDLTPRLLCSLPLKLDRLIRDHFLDRRGWRFRPSSRRWAGCTAGVLQQDRGLVADGPARPILIIVSGPNLHPFGRIRKRQEPVRVQALTPEAAVECEEGSGIDPVDQLPLRNMKALPVGLPGREKSSVTRFA